MTHVAPMPDKPPFMYGFTAFHTGLRSLISRVVVEFVVVVVVVVVVCRSRSIRRAASLCGWEFEMKVILLKVSSIGDLEWCVCAR